MSGVSHRLRCAGIAVQSTKAPDRGEAPAASTHERAGDADGGDPNIREYRICDAQKYVAALNSRAADVDSLSKPSRCQLYW